jgi:hypothetical protein
MKMDLLKEEEFGTGNIKVAVRVKPITEYY